MIRIEKEIRERVGDNILGRFDQFIWHIRGKV